MKTKLEEPEGNRLPFYRLVNKRSFEYTITFFIIVNTIIMSINHYRMVEELVDFAEKSNFVFSFIFNIEMILKQIGLGRAYFYTTWNCFDFFIVVGSDIGIILSIFDVGGSVTTATTVIRGVRIMRMFRLIKTSVHIRLLLDTIMNILPQITNVMTLILLLYFIYAALGINLFSGIML